MNKLVNFLIGMLLGAAVGAGVALLFAPMSGEELRTTAQSQAEKTMDNVKTAVEDERKRLENELDALKRGEIKIS